MNFQTITQTLAVWLAAFGMKILGAIALWVIGRWLIHFSVGLIVRGLKKRPIEPTVINYLASTVSVLLNITLVVAILGYFGVQTTTFAALIASAGLAIGLAWSGLLSNFAAGAFLMILRPFKVGDFITAGGVTGTVQDIGLFVTAIDAPDNVRNFVGNGKIFADKIQNFSINPYRRVELEAQLDHTVNVADAVQRLEAESSGDTKRHGHAGGRRRSVEVFAVWAGAGSQAVHQQSTLLAGLLRYEQSDSRHVCRSRITDARTAPCREQFGFL
jgi:small conductance mechanosensitive channel